MLDHARLEAGGLDRGCGSPSLVRAPSRGRGSGARRRRGRRAGSGSPPRRPPASSDAHSITGLTSAWIGPSRLDAVDEQRGADADLRRGEPDAVARRAISAPMRSISARRASSKRRRSAAPGLQDRVAELDDLRERRLAPRPDLGIERRRLACAPSSASSGRRRAGARASAIADVDRRCSSARASLRVDVDAKRDAAVLAVARRARRPPRRSPSTARGRSAALTTIWQRSLPRRRNSGAGPSTLATSGGSAASRRARSAPAAASGAPASSRGADDPDQRRERRVAQRRAALELAGEEARRRRGCAAATIGAASGHRVCTSTRPSRGPAAGAAGELGDERERALLGAEVREAQRRSASSTTPSVDVGEVVALGDHLRAEQDAAVGAPRTRASTAAAPPARPRRRRAGDDAARRSSVLEPLGPGAVAGDRRPSRSPGSASGTRSRWPQWWQASVAARAVQHERDVAVRALPGAAAGRAGEEVRPAAAVEQHDRLARVDERLGASRVQRAAHAAHVEDLDGGHRRAVDALRAARSGAARSQVSAPRRRAAGDEHRARGRPRARSATCAGVVARVALVLVGGVVLLVDDDQPEVVDRREHGRARPDADPRLAAAQAQPLVVALARRRARSAAPRRCRRSAPGSAPTICGVSAISGHEHDHACGRRASVARRGAQVDLGLARAGDAVQQQPLAGRGARDRRPATARWSAVSSRRLARRRARRPRCARARGARRAARSSRVRDPRAAAARPCRRP